MSCNLSERALFILYVLYSNKCLRNNRGYNSKKLSSIYNRKFSYDFKEAIREILGNYITPIKKKDTKYYISNIPSTMFALDSHGFPVTKGKVRQLK